MSDWIRGLNPKPHVVMFGVCAPYKTTFSAIYAPCTSRAAPRVVLWSQASTYCRTLRGYVSFVSSSPGVPTDEVTERPDACEWANPEAG